MPAEDGPWRGLAAMVAALAATGLAAPVGRILGHWIILRDAAPPVGPAQAWVVAGAGGAVILAAIGLAARTAARAILVAFCLMLLVAAGVGAWQAVAAGAAAYRDGPLNAAL